MKRVTMGEGYVELQSVNGKLYLSIRTLGPTVLFALKPECPSITDGEKLSEVTLHILREVALVVRECANLGDPVATGCAPAPTAHEYLTNAGKLLGERGQEYDRSGNERSGGRVAAAFNAITGKYLTAADVYLLLQCVKDVRQWTKPAFHPDSAVDSVAFAALKSEALAQGV